MNNQEIQENILKTLPSWIAIAFGDPISKVAGGMSLLAEGWAIQRKRNKDWWDSYLEAWEVVETIQEQIKQPEYIQFIRDVIMKVTFETREEKRKYLLNFARNYHFKYDKIVFDKKMLFLNILDSLSVEELLYLLYFYNKIDNIKDTILGQSESLNEKLSNQGLISRDYSKIQDNFEQIGDDMKKMMESYNEYLQELERNMGDDKYGMFHRRPESRNVIKFDSFFDRFEVKFGETKFGQEFADFIFNEDIDTQSQDLSEFV